MYILGSYKRVKAKWRKEKDLGEVELNWQTNVLRQIEGWAGFGVGSVEKWDNDVRIDSSGQ